MIPSFPSGGTVCQLLSFGGVGCLIVLCCRDFFFVSILPVILEVRLCVSKSSHQSLSTFILVIISGLVESLSFCLRRVDPLLFHCVTFFFFFFWTQHSYSLRWLFWSTDSFAHCSTMPLWKPLKSCLFCPSSLHVLSIKEQQHCQNVL